MTGLARLEVAVWEAQRHAVALTGALVDWVPVQHLSLEEIERDQTVVRLLDQILYRFTKLQDALGERLIPATLAALSEPFEDWPVRDRLNRLEKLGYLEVDDWLRWREVRNRLAHEYPDAPDLRLAALKAGIAAAEELLAAWRRWRQRLALA